MKREEIQNKISLLELKRERYLRLAEDVEASRYGGGSDRDWLEDKAAKIQKKIDNLKERLEWRDTMGIEG